MSRAWLALALCLATAAAAGEESVREWSGLGPVSRQPDTRIKLVHEYFDNGLALAYAFNHAAAGRSFAEALRRDPECGMCAWGVALVLGPHINAAMEASAA